MTQLSTDEILQILNTHPQPPTSATTLPGTDMIPVPLTSLPTDPQPGTSAQGMFSSTTPQLPVPPPSILEHAHDLLKKHKASKCQPPKEPVVEPSRSGQEQQERGDGTSD